MIATAKADLSERVAHDDFRRDLFYRLNVLHLALPPARPGFALVPSLLDCLTSELANGWGAESPRLSVHHPGELLASDLLVDAAQLRPLLASVSRPPSA